MARTKFVKHAAIGLAAFGICFGLQTPKAGASHYLGYHWNRVNTAIAQVYYVDHTGPAWPVNSSVVQWNATNRLGVYCRTPSQGCPGSNVGCVHVWEVNTPDPYYGTTSYSGSGGHFTFAAVYLNNYYYLDGVGHRHTACQEVGHAFGLSHQYAPDSCMNDSVLNTQYPNNHDYDQIRAIYNH